MHWTEEIAKAQTRPGDKGDKRYLALGAAGAGSIAGVPAVSHIEYGHMNRKLKRIDAESKKVAANPPPKPQPTKGPNGNMIGVPKEAKASWKKAMGAHQQQLQDLNIARKAVKPRISSKQTLLWGGATGIGGAAALVGAHKGFDKRPSKVSKKIYRDDATTATAGGLLGFGAYQGGMMAAIKPVDRRAERKVKQNPEHVAAVNAHKKAHGIDGPIVAGNKAHREYFKTYPKSVPGGKVKRVIATTHTGKPGYAASLAATGLGAAGLLHVKHERDKETVHKAKRKTDNKTTGGAIAGAGASTTGLGLLAGGAPGGRVEVKNWTTPGSKHDISSARAGRGGILGFRAKHHEETVRDFQRKKLADDIVEHPTKQQSFFHGYNAGKIKPEHEIIAGMKAGRKFANKAAAGGVAATAYGIHRMHQPDKIKKSNDSARTKSAVALGAGSAGVGLAHGAGHYFGRQERSFRAKGNESRATAEKIIPGLKGKSESAVLREPGVLDSVGPRGAKAAGKMVGAAKQYHHFADVFGNVQRGVHAARVPSAVVATAGAGGLLATKRKQKVKKSSTNSAFGVDHG